MTLTHELALGLTSDRALPGCPSYRPPSWPPPDDWVVSEDASGNPVSRWGDKCWDFSYLIGSSAKINFVAVGARRQGDNLSAENEHALKMVATWMIWGYRAERRWNSLKNIFGSIRRLVSFCDRNGVKARDLYRFPRLVEQIPGLFKNVATLQVVVLCLDRLLAAEDALGFKLLDRESIGRVSQVADALDGEDVVQSAYIPPRIWVYQIARLRECLNEFLENAQKIEECFRFCVDAYVNNFGSVERAVLAQKALGYLNPFEGSRAKKNKSAVGRRYYESFETEAKRFGIYELLERWVKPEKERVTLKTFSAYLSLIQSAGLAYIANFTLQRKDEVGALRADCLVWESDPLVGRIAIIRGETTKTIEQKEAYWPTSPSVEYAVKAMEVVAMLRAGCAAAVPGISCSAQDLVNPYLFHSSFEPWLYSSERMRPYAIRPVVHSYQHTLRRFPRLLDAKQLMITEDDMSKAMMFTPNLADDGRFKIGGVWPLAYHQLRRTGAVNMFASGLLSDSSIQALLKHLTLMQSYYYGQNYSRLRFNEEVDAAITSAKYQVLGQQLRALVSERYVSPMGADRKNELIVRLVGSRDFKELEKAGRRGEVSFRETRLGGCVKVGPCDYGGIESIARCAGGDGEKPCQDAIFDRKKQQQISKQLDDVNRTCDASGEDGPRTRALQAEARGLRSFLDVVNREANS